MGIRIKVCLGYGLTDLEGKEDKRFNPDGYMLADCETQEDKWSFDGYLKVLEKHDSFVHTLYTKCSDRPTKRNPNIYDLLVHDDEFGEKNVLCLVSPTSFESHRRYDDTLDYYLYDGIIKNHVKEIKGGIFPHNGLYVNKKTGERVPQGAQYVEVWDYFHKVSTNAYEAVSSFVYLNKVAKMLGFDGYFDFRDNINTEVPSDIIALCEYTKLFENPKTVYDLKPMLYVYWG